jgi:hypothetical protein
MDSLTIPNSGIPQSPPFGSKLKSGQPIYSTANPGSSGASLPSRVGPQPGAGANPGRFSGTSMIRKTLIYHWFRPSSPVTMRH